jgi:hypothetical protein
MKRYTVIFRDRNNCKLKAIVLDAENQKKAITSATLKLPKNGHFEYMWHKEEKPKDKKK